MKGREGKMVGWLNGRFVNRKVGGVLLINNGPLNLYLCISNGSFSGSVNIRNPMMVVKVYEKSCLIKEV